ncbi:MAG TPA: hypothetical protein VG318_01695 [Actinomycetota bacterium]|nr:hypothetical protein [Actinomycetota bacterium]
MKRGPRIALAGVVVLVVGVIVLVATGPHFWAGRLLCEVRGGEWTNRSSTRWESLVSSGYRCEGV